jgi:hypothetical protein
MATGLFNLKQVNQAISQGSWSGYIAPRWVEYLVVAGGGSGGSGFGGGGGAGGLLTGIVTVATATSYSVTVGAGGADVYNAVGNSGSNSVFGNITSLGGGGGASNYGSGGNAGSGGSGGGASVAPYIQGSGTFGQGNSGGAPFATGGGGGGAGTAGIGATDVCNGGAGIGSLITGTLQTFAGGGGGRGSPSSSGGVGGGGAGSGNSPGVPISGTANTGGGGGGGRSNFFSASGGSGIVVVRYPGNVQFYTGGAVTYASGYIVHIFYANGTLAPTTPAVVATDYQISRSLRFNKADGSNLTRTVSNSNRRTYTFSAWIKRSDLNTSNINTPAILMATDQSSGSAYLTFGRYGADIDSLNFNEQSGGSNTTTSAVFRDVSAWYHIVLAVDTTQAISTNRVKIYVNGLDQTFTAGSTYPPVNTQTYFNYSAFPNKLGTYSGTNDSYQFGGYMTEVNFIDGQQLAATSFGATNTNTGVWGPKAYTGTYGTNGFYLNFSDNSNTTAATLGKDYSGNGNNWTPNNFSVTAGAGNDSFVDSPTSYGTDTGVGGTVRGNYSTFNPLVVAYATPTFSNGNLDLSASGNWNGSVGTIGVTSGKWYWETVCGNGDAFSGICGSNAVLATLNPQNINGTIVYYGGSGEKRIDGTASAYGASYTTETIGVALDIDGGTITFYKNNTSQGSISLSSSTLNGLIIFPFFVKYLSTMTVNFGQRPFAYTAPSGFKALCTTNLPAPTIGSSPTTLATQFFGVSTFTGDGTNSQVISNSGFQPDWVWFKARSNAQGSSLVDSVRGTTKILTSNSIAAEATGTNPITFNSNGFTSTTDFSTSGYTYAAWQWRASNAAAVSNTAGTITSQVSVNLASGFSIVIYTGNSTAGATRGHGLNAVPKMIFVKGRVGTYGADNWHVYHASLPNTQGLSLNSDAGATTSSYFWNDTSPTSTVFTTNNGSSNNFSGQTYVAYCFAEVAGYSAFGSYTGNGVSDGTFVYTGFRPAFIMIKRTDTGTSDWQIIDTTRDAINASGLLLQPNTNSAESNATPVLDFLSNGFKNRNSYNVSNYSSGTYVYAAFASTPFKYSLAR